MRRAAIAASLVLLLLVLLAAVYLGGRVFLVAFAGLLLSVLLRTFTEWTQAFTGLRHGWSFAIVLTLAVLLLAGGGWALTPRISAQVEDLSRTLPESLRTIEEWLRQYEWGRALLGQVPDPAEVELPAPDVGRVGAVFSSVAGVVAAVLFVLFIGIYVAAEPGKYKQGLLHLVPLGWRRRTGEVLAVMDFALRWWLVAQLVSMMFLTVTTALLLWLLEIPLALTLGLIVGVLTFIPYLGPIIGFVPVVLLVLAADPGKLAWVVPGYLVIQNLEGYLITPMVQRQAVRLPPALTLGFQLLVGVTVGIPGFVLATPLLVVVMVAVQQVYVAWLGDRTFLREAET